MKKYVPELARYSRKYIYEPWTAPIADQKSWGCRITGDGNEAEMDDDTVKAGAAATSSQKMKTYPKPMFDFSERREICIESIKNAYKINLHGADPDVLNGTWKKLFDDSPGRDLLEGPGEHDEEGLRPREESAGGSVEEGTDEDEREAAETGEGEREGNQDEEMRERSDGGVDSSDGGRRGEEGRDRKRRKVE